MSTQAGIRLAAELQADVRAMSPWIERVQAALQDVEPWDEDTGLLVAVAMHQSGINATADTILTESAMAWIG